MKLVNFICTALFCQNIAIASALSFYPPPNSEDSEDRITNTTLNVQQNQLLAVIPEWGPNFRISFDLNIKSMYSSRSDGWASILHFTATGKDCCSLGDRVPALFSNNKQNYLAFMSNVDNNGNFWKATPAGSVPTNTWSKIKIEQKFEGFQWRYTVQVEGVGTLINVINKKPKIWQNVAVYAGDPFYPATHATIRNLDYASSSSFAPLP